MQITIQMDDDLAQIYQGASQEQRQKMQALWSVLVRQMASGDAASLSSVMDEISDAAQARGLTPEILDDLLRDGD